MAGKQKFSLLTRIARWLSPEMARLADIGERFDPRRERGSRSRRELKVRELTFSERMRMKREGEAEYARQRLNSMFGDE